MPHKLRDWRIKALLQELAKEDTPLSHIFLKDIYNRNKSNTIQTKFTLPPLSSGSAQSNSDNNT
eukprot:2393708-Ditylum_brightwellii.AAC.1